MRRLGKTACRHQGSQGVDGQEQIHGICIVIEEMPESAWSHRFMSVEQTPWKRPSSASTQEQLEKYLAPVARGEKYRALLTERRRVRRRRRSYYRGS